MSCPHCPHCNPDLMVKAPQDDAIDGLRLSEECRRRGYWISPDGRVREHDAAELMGLKPKTLKNRRSLEDPNLPSFEIRAGRALYSITSLSEWLKRES